jgi:hypothetical protein
MPPFVDKRGRDRGGSRARVPRSRSPVRLSGARGEREGGAYLYALPFIHRLRTEAGWREPCGRKGRGRQRGCALAGAAQQEGAGACNCLLHAPAPSVPPLFACRVACKGGRAAQGGRRAALGRRRHVSHVAAHPCALFANGEGGGVPRRPAPVPCRGANERPPLAHERGRAKGVVGVCAP